MISDITLNARAREGVGKGFARRLRADGMLPVTVYGGGQEPLAVAISARELANILRSDTGHNTIFNLALPEGGPATVIVKDWQVDPVKGRLLHADLVRISLHTVTRVSVAVEAVGEPVGVKLEGGILDLGLREVEVECLPADIPERVQVDVSKLHVGDHALVSDLVYDRDKVKVLTDESLIVAGVLAPRLAEAPPAEVPAAVEPAAEPEVIKKGKPEEE